jgi:glucose dehydrogenase
MSQLNNYIFKLLISLSTICGFNTNAELDPNGWPQSNGGSDSNKFINFNQINKQTIPKLTKAWEFNSNERDITDTVQTTPIYVANLVITVTVDGTINALEPSTGKLAWTRKLPWHSARRGLASSANRIYIPTPSETHEIDPKNGLTLQTFSAGSKVPPILHDDKIYIAETSSVSAFSITTGKKIWSRSLEKMGHALEYGRVSLMILETIFSLSSPQTIHYTKI